MYLQSDEFAPVHYADKDQIKSNLIDLMLSQPKNIQKPLSSALQIISSHDFPHNWQSLIPTMVERLNTTDFGAITSVMQALNSVFKAYGSVICVFYHMQLLWVFSYIFVFLV
jgi:hypothetical protein